MHALFALVKSPTMAARVSLFCLALVTPSLAQAEIVISKTAIPKAETGSIIQQCLTLTNMGPLEARLVSASDTLPTNITYIPGSLGTGSSCLGADAAEDDDALGEDEHDPVGASIKDGVIYLQSPTLAAGASLTIKFKSRVN